MFDVSVITPFYNEPFETLERCLRSVQVQKTKYNFEQVVVYDGGNYGSSEFQRNAEMLLDMFPHVILHCHAQSDNRPYTE